MMRAAALTLVMWLIGATSSLAQEPATRVEADRQRRADKNDHLQPYTPGSFERLMHLVEENAIFIVGREGFYPKLGSLTTGSGFAYGSGYRDRDLFNVEWILVGVERELYASSSELSRHRI